MEYGITNDESPLLDPVYVVKVTLTAVYSVQFL